MSLYIQEEQEADVDSFLLATYAFKFLQSYSTIASWAAVRVADESEDEAGIFAGRDSVIQMSIRSLEAGDYETVVANLNLMTAIGEQAGASQALLGKYFAKYNETVELEQCYSRLFTVFYVLGSLLLAVGFLYPKLKAP